MNFSIEGVVATLDNATDPTVVILDDGSYMMAIARNKELKIQFFKSNDGYKFKKLNNIRCGIPELSLNSESTPELLFQDKGGFVLKSSKNCGKSWKTLRQNVLIDAPKSSASPSVLRLSPNDRLMFYVSIKQGCSTPPTAYLGDKNSLMPKGHQNQATGAPPLGHGVSQDSKKKKKN